MNVTDTTRRRFIGAAAGVAASTMAGRAALAQESTPGASPVASPAASPVAGSGEWTWTDAKGVTVTLPQAPARIAADINAASALWDFGIRPIAVFGWNATDTGDFGAAGGNVDPATVTVTGFGAEPIDVEALATVDPDLVITLSWSNVPTDYWSVLDENILAQVQGVAPLIAIDATLRADEGVPGVEALAVALGTDVSSPEVVEQRAAYDRAVEGFSSVAASKPDVDVLFIAPFEAEVYVANLADWADLTFFQSLGLNVFDVGVEPGTYWETLNWETFGQYQTDLVLTSARENEAVDQVQLVVDSAVVGIPAVDAGQVGLWNQDFILSYRGLTETLDLTLTYLRDAEDVV